MSGVKKAILLLAGRGRRLNSLTERRPKCLIPVGTMTILERALRSLSSCGITEAVLVVGYRADAIRAFVGEEFAGIEITYLHNGRYSETNTAYTLWLARQYMDNAVCLLEGDIVVDEKGLYRVFGRFSEISVWAGVPLSEQEAEGILLRQNEKDIVETIGLVRKPGDYNNTFTYKCAGIQVLTARMARAFASELDTRIEAGQLNTFADLVLGDLLSEIPMRLCSLQGLRWAEIDDLDDYVAAQRIFNGTAKHVRSTHL